IRTFRPSTMRARRHSSPCSTCWPKPKRARIPASPPRRGGADCRGFFAGPKEEQEGKMPFDFIGTPRLENLLKTRAILDTQTDSDQDRFATCLWHGLHKAGLISRDANRNREVMRVLGVEERTAKDL